MTQAPICSNYDNEGSGAALILWPSGRVQRFPTLAKAKTMLMRQHYIYICMTIDEVNEYIIDNRAEWYEKWKIQDNDEIDDLWAYLMDISEVRDPWAKHSDRPETKKLTKRATSSGYLLSHAKCKAFDSVKAPKQAKVIARVFLDRFEDGTAIDDKSIESELHKATVSGVLVTKQPVMRIFAYYRQSLLDNSVITLR